MSPLKKHHGYFHVNFDISSAYHSNLVACDLDLFSVPLPGRGDTESVNDRIYSIL